jgi:hypothetical protein
MNSRPAPKVYLDPNGNPWAGTLDDGVVLQFLRTAAMKGEEQIEEWIKAGKAGPGATFAQVYLDPTNPRDQLTIKDRIFAIVAHGDPVKALMCLPNAAAKADAGDRHGRPNGELVEQANFCLGDGDFAWGDSAYYRGATSAGSGLTTEQDRDLAQLTLERTMDAVHNKRARWLAERRLAGSQNWYNEGNRPGDQYESIVSRDLRPLHLRLESDWLTLTLS